MRATAAEPLGAIIGLSDIDQTEEVELGTRERYFPWATDAQWECCLLLRDLRYGWHHVARHLVRSCPPHGVSYRFETSDLATADGNTLTRLVIMAHDRAIRAAIGPSARNLVVLRLHKRGTRSGRIHERHNSMETAMRLVRRGQ